jgi:membrane-associated phospholipid phosphatase
MKKNIVLFFICITSLFSHNTNVYETTWIKDGLLISSGLVSAFGGSALDNSDSVKMSDIKLLNRNDLNFLDKPASYNYDIKLSNLSDILVASAIVSPIVFVVDGNMQKDWDKISLMYIETMLLAGTLPSFGKASYRVRPYAYNNIDGVVDGMSEEKLLSPDTHRSFFSGHTTVAFASSIFVAKVYNDYYPNSEFKNYIWAGSFLLASSVGYLRYASGYHFPTDILTGAIIGSAIGYLIPEIHKIKSNAKLQSGVGGNFIGLNFSYKF